MLERVEAAGDFPAVRQQVAVGVALVRIGAEFHFAGGEQSVVIGIGVNGQTHFQPLELVKNILIQGQVFAQICRVELAILVLRLGINAPGADDRANCDFVVRLQITQGRVGDGQLDEVGIGFIEVGVGPLFWMGQLRRTVELLKMGASHVAERFVELKHALAKREGERGNVLRIFTSGHIDGESRTAKVAGLVIGPFIAEDCRHTWFEVGEG